MITLIHSLAAIAALSSLSLAAPSSLESRADSYVTANYDDLLVTPVSIIPLTTYKGLSYQALFLDTRLAGTPGVQLPSAPNCVVYGSYGGVLTGKVPSIKAVGSQTFTLKSFYYSCSVNGAETVADKPTPCTVTANGYNKAGQKFSLDFNFSPGIALSYPLQLATLPSSWTGLTTVSFVTSGAIGQTLIGTQIDNVTYKINSS